MPFFRIGLSMLTAAGALCGIACGADPTPAPERDAVPAAQVGRKSSPQGSADAWPKHTLRAEQTWQLNLPKRERFDASGLLLQSNGELWTVNDRGATLYRVQFTPGTNYAELVEITTCFSPAQLKDFARGGVQRYDCEGIAQDDQRRIYLCEEANRWILRCTPEQGKIEKLHIDWSPVRNYIDPTDLNASFEGIAISGNRLFVANERQMGRIIVVDLETLAIVDNFSVRASGSNARDVHYSDLSVFDGILYVLLRESRCVLAVEPDSHKVLAEYDFRQLEREPEVLYRSIFPTGQMEGLAVDQDSIWLVTDNNGTVRARYPADIRPTLFKCRRAPLVR